MVLSIPLVRRTREPFSGRWALPGGWADEAESLAETAARKLFETTDLAPAYLEQLYAFGDLERSPSGRVVSIVYWALVREELAQQAAEGANVRWFAADDLPELAFDHNRIVEYALWRLRNKLEYSRIAHAFLGETFTLSELRQVHEVVLLQAARSRQLPAAGRGRARDRGDRPARHRRPPPAAAPLPLRHIHRARRQRPRSPKQNASGK